MRAILDLKAEVLVSELSEVAEVLIASCSASGGDLHHAEEAIARALWSVRSILVSGAVSACISSVEGDYSCPCCRCKLTVWGHSTRTIVTSSGEGRFISTRYRCCRCKTSYYPWQTANGVDEKTQFTLSARQMIAEEAASSPFADASGRLQRMGLIVSASEVDRIAREVGQWRKQEQEVVRSYSCQAEGELSVPLHDWSLWPSATDTDDTIVFSVDGAKARSVDSGPSGLEWFEVRSGIIRLSRKFRPSLKVCLGGVMDPDKLFETMRSQWRQCPLASSRQRSTRMVFVADGAEWIWDRVGWHFPRCTQVLDIYHAAEHVGSAARAAWAECAQSERWIKGAIAWLIEQNGPRTILKAICGVLRSGRAANPEQLRIEMRYLWRHRHRMKYHACLAQGLPIGSGAMESTIKQLSTQRLRYAGMKWTRSNADLMVHLRAAVLSKSLHLTVQRERQIRANRAKLFLSSNTQLPRAA